MDKEIKPNQVYTTEEAQEYLKVSKSTMKRLLKKGIIKANKVGGRYRIVGYEILKLVSPEVANEATTFYRKITEKIKKTIERW